MRIGLLTIFRCVNYGAVLQATALKEILSRQFPNATIDVINHYMDPRDNHLLGKITNPNTPWFQRWRNKRKFQKQFYRPDFFETRRERTIQFINKLLTPTKYIFKTPEALGKLQPYDVVIVGSDQIWNPVLNHDFKINPYLCTTIPEKQRRVSYAASFGIGTLPEEVKASFRVALSKFDVITVREETGATICEELLNTRPPVVVDPTMLLNEQGWRNILSSLGHNGESAEKNYLFAYWVRTPTQADIDALSAHAQRAGLPIHLLVAGQLPKLNFPENVVPKTDSGPCEWLAQLAESDGVITDGFHGLQFAVNFSKPVLALGELTNVKSDASRLTDFCARCGIANACAEIQEFRAGKPCTLVPINDPSVLDEGRVRSTQLLKEMVEA